jgi:hypothetical protein
LVSFFSKQLIIAGVVSSEIVSPTILVSNIALGKPTIGSSQYETHRTDYAPAGVTDGIIHADLTYGSCFHSLRELNPWVLIDLEGNYVLYWVEIYPRMECCGG